MNAPLVRARHVGKTYGQGALAVPVLRDVSIDVLPGELTLLMGPSGSGKTTLISILAGLMRPSAGSVELCGATITELSDPEVSAVRRRHLGFVFQTYNLFPALSALDNVATVLGMKGVSPVLAQRGAREMLERVGLGDRLDHLPGELSGGQKQRVALARALAGDPALVIGDEVTAALDTASGMRVIELLREHVRPETGVLLVTHDHRLEPLADRILAMEDGAIVEERRTLRTKEAS